MQRAQRDDPGGAQSPKFRGVRPRLRQLLLQVSRRARGALFRGVWRRGQRLSSIFSQVHLEESAVSPESRRACGLGRQRTLLPA